MDCLSRKTKAWQSCNTAVETDSPRTSELKLLRTRRVAYYESIGIIKTSSLENDRRSILKVPPRAPLDTIASPLESHISTSRDNRQSPHSAVSEDVNMCHPLPKDADEKIKEDSTNMGEQVQGECRRNSCRSELDLSLINDVFIPETQKLRHVMNWAQRFLTKCQEGQELKSSPDNPVPILSLVDQSKTIQDCHQDAFMSFCHPPTWSREEEPRIHSDSQNSFNFSSVPTYNLSETHYPMDLLSSFEEKSFLGNQSDGGQEAEFQEKRPPVSPLVGFRQTCLVQPICDSHGHAYSQKQREPGKAGMPSKIISVQSQPKDSWEISLFEKVKEDQHGKDYFWTPLIDSSDDECTDENGQTCVTFRKGTQLRDSKEVLGMSLSPRGPKSTMDWRSPRLKDSILSLWEADVSEKSKEGEITIWKPRDTTSRFQDDSPWYKSSSVPIRKLSTDQFDPSADNFRMRKEESLSQELDFVGSLRNLSYRSGLLPECMEEADKTFVDQTKRGIQEVGVHGGLDLGESKIYKRGQRQINVRCWGNDSVTQISNPQLNSQGDPSENVASKICSDCVSGCELTSGHLCVICHNIRVDLLSPTRIDRKTTQIPDVIAKKMTCENKKRSIFSSDPISKVLPKTISEGSSSLSRQEGSGPRRLFRDDALSEKSEHKATVLETYFFYLNQLNKIRGCNLEEGSSSFPNHFIGHLENNVNKGHPEKKNIGEGIRSNERSVTPTIKMTSKATGCMKYWKKSNVAWSSHKCGEQELRSKTMSGSRSAKVEKRKSMESSQSICPSGSTPKHLCKNVYIDLETEMENKNSQGDSALSMWQLLPDEIWLYIFSLLSHEELSQVAQVCRHFHQLASDDSFWKRIYIADCRFLNDDWLVTLGLHHPQSFTLHRCHDDIQAITDRGLKQFFHHCRESLQELNITSCNGTRLKGDKLLLYASTFCNRLAIVDISWTGATDLGVLALVEGASSLQGLSINGCQITDKAIKGLVKKHGNSLTKLEVFGCYALTARCVGCLALSCPHLQILNIGRVPKITESCFVKILRNLRKITTLNVTGLEMVRDRVVHLIVTQCLNLDRLVLSSCSRVTDISLMEISTYLRTIRYLDVSGCKKVTDIGVQALARSCHQLHYLDLSSTGTSRRGVSLLASYCHSTLECVKLSFCKDITLDSVKKLCKNCIRLKKLHLYGCCITPDLSSIKDVYKTVEVLHDVSASTH